MQRTAPGRGAAGAQDLHWEPEGGKARVKETPQLPEQLLLYGSGAAFLCRIQPGAEPVQLRGQRCQEARQLRKKVRVLDPGSVQGWPLL